MKKPRADRLRRLARIEAGSSSDEEFRLKAAACGFGFWTTALFRLCLFRNEHPCLRWLEIAAVWLGGAGFWLWGGLVVNAFAAVGILLLALAVLVPLELLFLRFEELCYDLRLEELRRDLFGVR